MLILALLLIAAVVAAAFVYLLMNRGSGDAVKFDLPAAAPAGVIAPPRASEAPLPTAPPPAPLTVEPAPVVTPARPAVPSAGATGGKPASPVARPRAGDAVNKAPDASPARPTAAMPAASAPAPQPQPQPQPPVPVPSVPRTAPPSTPAWRDALIRELHECEATNVFERIVCAERAKWKHCEPDRWGTVAECPGTALPKKP